MPNFTAIGRRTFLFGLAGLGTSLYLPKSWASLSYCQPFSFAFVTGTHLISGESDTYKLTQESQLFLQDAVKQLNHLNLDFVLFGGDQVDLVGEDEANWQLFIDIVQSLNCPWAFILGERDVSGTIPVDKLKTYGRDWKGKGLTGNQPYWSQDILSGVHLIGLDTSVANSEMGELSSEQLAWLQEDLNQHKRQFVIVASHHPLLPPDPYDGGPPWDDFLVPQAASAREILNSSPYVRLAISGHIYADKVQREKDIWYLSCPSLDVYPCAFKVFHVDAQAVTVATYQVDYPALVKKARLALAASTIAFHYNRAHSAAFLEVAEGAREEQNARLPFASGQSIEPAKRRNPVKQEAPKKQEVLTKKVKVEPEHEEKKSFWSRKPTAPKQNKPQNPEPESNDLPNGKRAAPADKQGSPPIDDASGDDKNPPPQPAPASTKESAVREENPDAK
jgi:Icc protein